MSDSGQTTPTVIAVIAVIAAVVLGFLWYQARQGTVAASVADSLRQENSQLSTTVQELRAAPPETVYAQPSGQSGMEGQTMERIRTELDALEAILPAAETHPAYYDRIRSIRAALDTASGS